MVQHEVGGEGADRGLARWPVRPQQLRNPGQACLSGQMAGSSDGRHVRAVFQYFWKFSW